MSKSQRVSLHSSASRSIRWIAACLLLFPASFSHAAETPADVRQTIFIDGRPSGHTLISLYSCKDGSRYAGPVSTADDGSVTFSKIVTGDYCERAEEQIGYSSKQVHIDTAVQNQRVDITEFVPSANWNDRLIPLVFCIFTVLVVIYPIGRYLLKAWTFRRDALIGQLSGESIVLYYQQFRSRERIPWLSGNPTNPRKAEKKSVGDPALKSSDYVAAFSHQFGVWYGRRYYVAPLVSLAILSIACARWGYYSLSLWITGVRSIESMFGLSAAAIAGAFVWIISDEIDRLRRRDFTSSDVYYYIFRLLLSVPFAWSLTRLQVTLQLGIPIAFFLGSFPTTTLFTVARRIVAKQASLGDDPSTGQLELEKLPSVGKQSAERFKDEGISTVSQLAYADPVDLTIRTNFDFNYVSDGISQALLYLYLGDQLPNLVIYSLRGAFEVNCLMEDLKSNDPATVTQANQALQDVTAFLASKSINMSPSTLKTTLYQVAYDPYTLFLVNIWPIGAAVASSSTPS